MDLKKEIKEAHKLVKLNESILLECLNKRDELVTYFDKNKIPYKNPNISLNECVQILKEEYVNKTLLND